MVLSCCCIGSGVEVGYVTLGSQGSSTTIAEAFMALLQQLKHRPLDWAAAAVAGLGAGAILMVLDLMWSLAITGEGPWAASRMIAAIVMGPQVLQSSAFSLSIVMVALLLHYAFGIVGGLVIAAVSAPLGLDSKFGLALLTGAVFGVVLYLVNFHGMTAFFPWFTEIRGWAAFLVNLIFGISTTLLYWKLERRGDEQPDLQHAR